MKADEKEEVIGFGFSSVLKKIGGRRRGKEIYPIVVLTAENYRMEDGVE